MIKVKKIVTFLAVATALISILSITANAVITGTATYSVHNASGAPSSANVLRDAGLFITNSHKNYISNNNTLYVNTSGGSFGVTTRFERGDYVVINAHHSVTDSSWTFCSSNQLIANRNVTYTVEITNTGSNGTIQANGEASY